MITGDSLHMLGPKFPELVVCNSFFFFFFEQSMPYYIFPGLTFQEDML